MVTLNSIIRFFRSSRHENGKTPLLGRKTWPMYCWGCLGLAMEWEWFAVDEYVPVRAVET